MYMQQITAAGCRRFLCDDNGAYILSISLALVPSRQLLDPYFIVEVRGDIAEVHGGEAVTVVAHNLWPELPRVDVGLHPAYDWYFHTIQGSIILDGVAEGGLRIPVIVTTNPLQIILRDLDEGWAVYRRIYATEGTSVPHETVLAADLEALVQALKSGDKRLEEVARVLATVDPAVVQGWGAKALRAAVSGDVEPLCSHLGDIAAYLRKPL